jgi:hypothetical protein
LQPPVPDTTARAISGHKTGSAHRRYLITQAATKAAARVAIEAAVNRAGQGLRRLNLSRQRPRSGPLQSSTRPGK